MRTTIINLLLLAILTSPLHAWAGPEQPNMYQLKPLALGNHSMIVTNNPWATEAARHILNNGGNAYDAAIAAGFVLGLTEPQSSGIGGGGYAIVYASASKQLLAYDGRETAPHSANPNWFLNKKGKPLAIKHVILSAKSIGVPGEIALFYKLHKDKGQLPWATLLQPAINLASKGFPLSPRLHKLLTFDRKVLENNPNVRTIFFNDDKIKSVGSIIKNPAYAETLRIIAKDPQTFYHGRLAQEIIHQINQTAGETLYNRSDFANYKALTHPPLCTKYREKYEICSIPPSSSGGVTVLELLGIYSTHYQTNQYSDTEWMYQFLEASKLAYADRNQYIADPAFVKQPINGLLAKEYIKNRSQLIKNTGLKTPVPAGTPQGIDSINTPDNSEKIPGTTSITIVDKDGNAISMTLSIESQFGSHVFTHGFFLNNELADFSFISKDKDGKLIANRIEPGKRPRSSMSPTMVFDKQHQLYALTGSPGGSEIICYIAKNIILMLDMHMKPDMASSTFNLCATNTDPTTEEFVTPTDIIHLLSDKGENIIPKALVSGVTNIVRRPNGGWYGAADPRREGTASGQ